MSRHTLPHKYGDKTSRDVRATLLSLLLEFVRETRGLAGVTRIALLGSLLTTKPFPKDADVLVTMGSDVDFERLAQLGRKLKGRAQGLNSGADIFLADASGVYVGRICHYRKCFPRRACQARHCGKVPTSTTTSTSSRSRASLSGDLHSLSIPSLRPAARCPQTSKRS